MPNPLLSVRIPPELNDLLPEPGDDRSKFVVEALWKAVKPVDPGDQLASLAARLEALERRLGATS